MSAFKNITLLFIIASFIFAGEAFSKKTTVFDHERCDTETLKNTLKKKTHDQIKADKKERKRLTHKQRKTEKAIKKAKRKEERVVAKNIKMARQSRNDQNNASLPFTRLINLRNRNNVHTIRMADIIMSLSPLDRRFVKPGRTAYVPKRYTNVDLSNLLKWVSQYERQSRGITQRMRTILKNKYGFQGK